MLESRPLLTDTLIVERDKLGINILCEIYLYIMAIPMSLKHCAKHCASLPNHGVYVEIF